MNEFNENKFILITQKSILKTKITIIYKFINEKLVN